MKSLCDIEQEQLAHMNLVHFLTFFKETRLKFIKRLIPLFIEECIKQILQHGERTMGNHYLLSGLPGGGDTMISYP